MKKTFNLVEVPLSKIFANRWNPNIQSEFIFDHQKKSLQTEGQIVPILVREVDGGFEIMDGEHRYKAAKEIGAESVIVNNLGKISDAKAMLIGQKLNRISGMDDPAKLKDMYKELLEDLPKEALLAELPITDLQFEEAIKDVDFDFDEMPSDSRKRDKGDDEWVKITMSVPKELKEQFYDQIDRFKKILYPNDNPKDVSEVMPLEAMLQVVAQTPDNHITGGEL